MGSSLRCIAKWRKRHLQSPKTLLVLFLTISVIYSWLPVVDKQQQHLNGSNITILLWHWPYGTQYSLAGDVCLRDYGISRCVLGDNRTLYESANLVVFHHFELRLHKQHLPVNLHRPAKQWWVWLSLEAPQNNGNLLPYNTLFNLTMSYHPQADITVPYGKLLQRRKPDLDFVIPKNKSMKPVGWFSNYKKQHIRSAVFQELKNHLKVQLYGLAAKKTLPKEALLPNDFTLLFLPSLWKHRVSTLYHWEALEKRFPGWDRACGAGTATQRLWSRGASEFLHHVDDFKSIKALAEYLRGLTKDPEKYNAYFTWRQGLYGQIIYRLERETVQYLSHIWTISNSKGLWGFESVDKMVT